MDKDINNNDNVQNESINENDELKEENINIKDDNIEQNDEANISTIDNKIVKYEVSDTKLLVAYINKNQNKILKQKFSIPAFLFNGYYLMYRKMYLLGFITCFLNLILIMAFNYFKYNIILYIFILLMLVIAILLGIFTNKIYLNKCYNNIMKIKKKNNKPEEELIKICNKKGGTSIIKMFLLAILCSIIVYVISLTLFLNIKKQIDNNSKNQDNININDNNNINNDTNNDIDNDINNDINNNINNNTNNNINNNINNDINNNTNNQTKKYSGSIMYDTTIDINKEFSVTIPNVFKEDITSNINQMNYKYTTTDAECEFLFTGVSDYTSSNTLIKEMAEYNNVTNIKQNKVNNITWDYFSTNTIGTSYYNATTKNNKVYLFEYKINNDNNKSVCMNYYNNILKTIKLK